MVILSCVMAIIRIRLTQHFLQMCIESNYLSEHRLSCYEIELNKRTELK
jgi:hypothetical protein